MRTGLLAIAVTLLVLTQGFAAPGEGVPLRSFFRAVSRITGTPEPTVRRQGLQALEELVGHGEYSSQALARVRVEQKTEFDSALENEAVRLLQRSKTFRVDTGLEALRITSGLSIAEAAFDALAASGTGLDVKAAGIGLEAAQLSVRIRQRQEAELSTARRELRIKHALYLRRVAKVLLAQDIRFDIVMDHGSPVLEIPLESNWGRIVAALPGLIKRLMTAKDRRAKTRAVFDSGDLSRYDFKRNTIYLGRDFLHRITEH